MSMSFANLQNDKAILIDKNIWSLKYSLDDKYLLCGGDGYLKILDA
jgi:hypothetical protein